MLNRLGNGLRTCWTSIRGRGRRQCLTGKSTWRSKVKGNDGGVVNGKERWAERGSVDKTLSSATESVKGYGRRPTTSECCVQTNEDHTHVHWHFNSARDGRTSPVLGHAHPRETDWTLRQTSFRWHSFFFFHYENSYAGRTVLWDGQTLWPKTSVETQNATQSIVLTVLFFFRRPAVAPTREAYILERRKTLFFSPAAQTQKRNREGEKGKKKKEVSRNARDRCCCDSDSPPPQNKVPDPFFFPPLAPRAPFRAKGRQTSREGRGLLEGIEMDFETRSAP